MEVKLQQAIERLAEKIDSEIKADDAMKFMQAALNAAHALQSLEAASRK